jgi:hypothetical protein
VLREATLPRPPLVWLAAPELLEGARLVAPDRLRRADGTEVGFGVVPPLPTNAAHVDPSTYEFYRRRTLRLRGETIAGPNGPAFVARTIWPEDARIPPTGLPLEPLWSMETIADLVRAQAPGWPDARLLWARGATSRRSWSGKPAVAIVLSGAQADSPGAEAGHLTVATGRLGPRGEWSDWLATNVYPLEVGEKGILSGPVPIDNYLADINSGQAFYRPVYALVAVLDDPLVAEAVQAVQQRVMLRYWCHDLEFQRASHNSTEMSIDGLREAGWHVPRVGGTSWFKGAAAWIGTVVTFRPRLAPDAWSFFTEELTDLLPAVAFEVAANDLLALAAGEAERSLTPLELRLRDDLLGVVFVRFPQIPTDRPVGTYPVFSLRGYRSRVALGEAGGGGGEVPPARALPPALGRACAEEIPPECFGDGDDRAAPGP